MPRKMSAEREREFEELRAYLEFFATHVWGIDPESPTHPDNTLVPIVQKYGRDWALAGLRQGVKDTIESTRHLPQRELDELNERFRAAGVASVSDMRRHHHPRTEIVQEKDRFSRNQNRGED